MRAQREQSVIGSGHSLAMLAASSAMAPVSALNHRLSGLRGIRFSKQFDDALRKDSNKLAAFADKLRELHHIISQAPRQFVLIGEHERLGDFEHVIQGTWHAQEENPGFAGFSLPAIREQSHQLWTTSTPVNFCARAYPVVPVEHEDAAALAVLSGFLRNGYLHRSIREHGGAYGGGASYQSDIAAFRFYSYRDPRLKDTLDDFDRSIDWLLNESHEWRQVEEAILGVISSIDKPSSPAGEAKDAFHNALFGRTPEQRQAYRARILQVTLEDLKRVGGTYFAKDRASTAVITNSMMVEQQGDFGLQVFNL